MGKRSWIGDPAMSETTASDFWSELPAVLDTCEELDDAAGAATLVAFLEDHKSTWRAIVASMRASADRRALFERCCLLLAERRPDDDGLPS
jgi:hypothetical protein